MKVLVVGAGKMGQWFYDYFSKRGFEPYFFEINKSVATELEDKGYRFGELSSADSFDAVLCSTNIKSVGDIASKLAEEGFRKPFIEISGVKLPVIESLRRLELPVSIHPLFGPGAKKLKGKRMVLVPVKDKEKELSAARSFFPEAEFIVRDAEEHDRMVSRTIQLVQLLSLIFNRLSPDEAWGTSTYMMRLVESTSLYGSENLIREVFELNPYTGELRDEVEKVLKEVFSGNQRFKKKDYFEELYRKSYEIIEGDKA